MLHVALGTQFSTAMPTSVPHVGVVSAQTGLLAARDQVPASGMRV